MPYNCRPAGPEDMISVYNFIKELADFEKMPDQVRINPEQLIKDGFGPDKPAFGCIVAEHKANDSAVPIIVGYALYYDCYSTWRGRSLFLEDLFVAEAHRKAGVGRQLFLHVAEIAHQDYSDRLDFHVLRWNPATRFYEALGAKNLTVTEDWCYYRLTDDDLKRALASK